MDPDQRAAQSRHSERIAFERQFMDATGLTRGNARRRLQDFDESLRGPSRAPAIIAETIPREPLTETRHTQNLPPKSFRQSNTAQRGGGGAAALPPTVRFITVKDAVAWYYDIPATDAGPV